MLATTRLDALQDLTELVSDLVELVINLLTQSFVLLLKSSNLLFETINALMMNILGDCVPRDHILVAGSLSTLASFAFALTFGRHLAGHWSKQDFEGFVVDLN